MSNGSLPDSFLKDAERIVSEASSSDWQSTDYDDLVVQLQSAHQAAIEELIGKDEPVDEELLRDSSPYDQPVTEWCKDARNQLRAEIRKRVGL